MIIVQESYLIVIFEERTLEEEKERVAGLLANETKNLASVEKITTGTSAALTFRVTMEVGILWSTFAWAVLRFFAYTSFPVKTLTFIHDGVSITVSPAPPTAVS